MRPSCSSGSTGWTGDDALRLPRQRRDELPVERHRPARLLQGRRPRGGHPDDPRRRPPVPGHPLRRRDGPRQASTSSGCGSPSRVTAARSPAGPATGMTRAEFDRAMPREFWREVVDRVAAEVPGTLLLAEAFWLLEGYFVRTLGMHRVYNSAFMNMLRDERNADYRLVIRNTLEFDPAILGRFVNFMSNPDERTAVDQFGTGDKYFGVAALHGDAARAADVRARPDRGLHREVRHGVPPGRSSTSRSTRACSPTTSGRSSRSSTAGPSFAGADGFRLYDVVDRRRLGQRGRLRLLERRAAAASARSSSTTTGTPRRAARSASRSGSTVATRTASAGCAARRWPSGLGLERPRGPLAADPRRDDRARGAALVGRDRPRRARGSQLGAYRCHVLVDLERARRRAGPTRRRRWRSSSATAGSRRSTRRWPGIALRPVHDAVRRPAGGRDGRLRRRQRRTAGRRSGRQRRRVAARRRPPRSSRSGSTGRRPGRVRRGARRRAVRRAAAAAGGRRGAPRSRSRRRRGRAWRRCRPRARHGAAGPAPARRRHRRRLVRRSRASPRRCRSTTPADGAGSIAMRSRSSRPPWRVLASDGPARPTPPGSPSWRTVPQPPGYRVDDLRGDAPRPTAPRGGPTSAGGGGDPPDAR